MQSAQTPDPDVQVASTAEASPRPLIPGTKLGQPATPSSVPVRALENESQLQTAEDDDEEVISSADEERISQALTLRNEREAESNKENIPARLEPRRDVTERYPGRRLIDPQPNALRLDFDTQESDSNRQASDVDDLSEDDGFQQQILPPNTGCRRGSKATTERAATPARSQRRQSPRVRVREANGSHRFNLRQNEHLDQPRLSQVEEYMAANAAAKERKALKIKPLQVRKAWTKEEIGRLLELIEEYGTSWKLLKDEDFTAGDILGCRDQVALKDKARNMKMDYLKYVNAHIHYSEC